MSVMDLARAEIRALNGYSSARMEAGQAAVMLNANESPWPPAATLVELNRYPEPQPARLLARLAELYDVEANQVFAGRGSDEAIDLLLRVFCRPGRDTVLIAPPTFGMYRVAATIQGVAVREAPLRRGHEFDPQALLAAVDQHTRLVFLCSPNNPTGGLIPLPIIARLAAELQGRALLVVDEAYIEFAGSASATRLLAEQDNVAVLRTLSKAWALAGARVGCLLAAPAVIALLRRVMAPYPLPSPCVEIALAVLADVTAMESRVALLVAERQRMAAALAGLPMVREVLPSAANFLCVRVDDAARVWRELAAHGVIVRDVSRQSGIEGCLRFGVGTAMENDALLAALASTRVAA
ncbi:MAG TPA: histidinol-phosphate transaminase [Rhodanobacteraceae bacterium]|nr:histidinol-phosphate transaminase [Rhodanobacteraceae bacterium]